MTTNTITNIQTIIIFKLAMPYMGFDCWCYELQHHLEISANPISWFDELVRNKPASEKWTEIKAARAFKLYDTLWRKGIIMNAKYCATDNSLSVRYHGIFSA